MSGIPIPQSGLRSATPYNLVLDAGVIYKNINESKLQSGLATAFTDAINPVNTWVDANGVTVSPSKFGATKGGTTVNIGKKERQVEYDSRRTYVKGMIRVDEIMPSIKTKLLEGGDYNTMEAMLGSSTVTDWTVYKEIVPSLVVLNTDYIGNIALVAPVSGSNLNIVVVLRNAKVFNPSGMNLQDKNEMSEDVEFIGSSLPGNQYAIPISFYVPVTTGS